MSLPFPSSPTLGQLWPYPPVVGIPVWTWDGREWTIGPLVSAVGPTYAPTYHIYGF